MITLEEANDKVNQILTTVQHYLSVQAENFSIDLNSEIAKLVLDKEFLIRNKAMSMVDTAFSGMDFYNLLCLCDMHNPIRITLLINEIELPSPTTDIIKAINDQRRAEKAAVDS